MSPPSYNILSSTTRSPFLLLRRALSLSSTPPPGPTTTPTLTKRRSVSQPTIFTTFPSNNISNRRFTTRSTNVNDAGSIDSPLMEAMEKKIKEQLNAESVTVKDAYGDGRHVSIDVISSSFEGQSAVNRQRMVYKAIWEELQNTVHAVDQMTTKTPFEAAGGK